MACSKMSKAIKERSARNPNAFVELEREVLTVTFYLESITPET